MQSSTVNRLITDIKKHILPKGGLSYQRNGPYRVDATSWAILALDAGGVNQGIIQPLRMRLASEQLPDGRLCILPDHPEAFWPTALAVLAWHGSADHLNSTSRAIGFLLDTTGFHRDRTSDSPMGHDPSIKGWPWIADTHSWVEPTALSIIALQVTGHENHPRLLEARDMLLDRQLPGGGWNYGNTSVFDKKLHPMPGPTGIAVQALINVVPQEHIAKSHRYLENTIVRVHTPLSLGWSLLGLSAWNKRPIDTHAHLRACVSRQERYGPYPSSQLCLLLLASICENGLISHLRSKGSG